MSNFGTTDFNQQVAMGLVSGAMSWTKFGTNPDVDIGTEVVAHFGGAFTPPLTADTLDIVSDDAADAAAGTGATNLVITGLAGDYTELTEVIAMNGVTPVTTTGSFLAINRVSVYLAGSSLANVGTISITRTTDLTTQAVLPPAHGVTQQCIFTTAANQKAIMTDLSVNALKLSGGGAPRVLIRALVYSAVSQARYEVYRTQIDTGIENHVVEGVTIPFILNEKNHMWFEATTDTNNTEVSLRFSFNTINY